MICKNCGQENPDGAKFCQFCGTPQNEPIVPALTLEPTPEPDLAPMPELSVEPSPEPLYDAAPEAAGVYAPAPEAPLPPVFEVEQPAAPMYTPVPAEPVYGSEAPYDYAQPMYEPEPNVPSDGSVLTWGILALAFGSFGFLVNFLGIIFGIIARKKSNAYINFHGTRTAKERVGRILGTIGIPVGIAFTVFWLLYIIIFAAVIAGIIGSAL